LGQQSSTKWNYLIGGGYDILLFPQIACALRP